VPIPVPYTRTLHVRTGPPICVGSGFSLAVNEGHRPPPVAVFRSVKFKVQKQSVKVSKKPARYKLAMLSDEPERNWSRKPKKNEHLDQHEHHFSHQIAPISASN